MAGLLCQCALMEYKSQCPVGDIFKRKKLSFDIIKAEIAKHKEEILNEKKLKKQLILIHRKAWI